MSGLPIEGRTFVVGAPRSGTTLVQGLLAAHSAVTSFTESHLFARHFSRPLAFGGVTFLVRDPIPRVREFLTENGLAVPGPGDEVAARVAATVAAGWRLPLRTGVVARRLLELFDELAVRRGAARWVEKTPRHLRYLPFLERLTRRDRPAHFVHVIRQGLETVASLHAASRHWERPYDLPTCVARWNADVAFSLARAGRPHDHFVFYEELTARPEETLDRLLTALGLDRQPGGVLEGLGPALQDLVTPEESWKRGFGEGVEPSATSTRVLDASQRRQAQAALRSDLYSRLRDLTAPDSVSGR